MLTTPRLVLRRWRPEDRGPFAALTADPEVMAHFPGVLDRAASDALADRCAATCDAAGLGLTAVERRDDGAFLGFVGVHRHRWYPDDVEIGWRLARHAWGRGYATEAARAWAERAFTVLGLPRLVSITTPANAASTAVMHRLGMVEGWRAEHEGQRVVVHVLDRARWAAGAAGTGP